RLALPCLALFGVAAVASAQAPSTNPPRSGRSQPGKKPAQSGIEASEIHVKAETQSGDPAHYMFRGLVDLVAGDLRIQADTLDLYTADKPDGTQAHRAIADGNVVFMRAEERLAGDHMDLDLETGKGFFEHALGYVEPGLFVEGDRIERIDERTYRVENG